MYNHPINSKAFKETWIKHYTNKEKNDLESIKSLSFTKNNFLPIYSSLAESFSPVSLYTANIEEQELKNKVLIIYNVPDYWIIKSPTSNRIKLDKVKEYIAYALNLNHFENFQAYTKAKPNKKTLKDVLRRKRILENCFDINYKVFYKEIDLPTYNQIFKKLKEFLKHKHDGKKEYYAYINRKTWNFYYEAVYQMIIEGTASLEVVYNEDIPINICLNFHFENICYSLFSAYNLSYSKFGLGSIDNLKGIENSYKRQQKSYDFLKGNYGYKKRWANQVYNFEHHIYYDNKSFLCTSIAFMIKIRFKTIQFLRKIGFNNLYYRILFYLFVRPNMSTNIKKISVSNIIEIETQIDNENYLKIDFMKKKYGYLHKIIFDFVYSIRVHVNNIRVYQLKNDPNCFEVHGEKKKIELMLR